MTVKDIKYLARSFGTSGELILNNAKYLGFNDWAYDFVTLDESKIELDTNIVKFYFVSGSTTYIHPVNITTLNYSPDWVIGEFYKEIYCEN